MLMMRVRGLAGSKWGSQWIRKLGRGSEPMAGISCSESDEVEDFEAMLKGSQRIQGHIKVVLRI